ncbi:MAG: (2Fe-2S)-binding protein [bacterium]|nr:(2Fe-2S)-binding protein [bacterium]
MFDKDSEIIVCRCEDLTLADIKALICQGYRNLDEIRRISRCGMGPCQGRTCRPLVQRELQIAGIPIKDQPPGVFRPPLKPITLGAIVRGSERGKQHD